MAAPPLSKAGPDIARRLSGIGKAVKKDRTDTLKAGALAAVKVHRARIKHDSGNDSRLSGVGKRGAKVGARFDMRGDRAEIKASGPLHFVANPMSPHRIPKRRKRGRKRHVVIPGVGVRASANHPGTKGKDTWNRAKPKARTKITKTIRTRQFDTIKRAFV